MRGARRQIGLVVAALAFAACSSRSGLVEQLDERAGMTIVRGRDPLVFARTEPRYSRSARDYLYLGPLATNRQGAREYYLWVGVASTLDRGFIAPAAELPQTLYVTVAGEPMELALKPLAEIVRRTSARPIYSTAVPLRAELAARVTLQQLALLDAANPQTLMVALGEGAQRNYVRWEGGDGFGEFVAGMAGR
jgi:hypothetical protein